MTLDPIIRDNIGLPAVCAPMFLVSNPALVTAACKVGIIGALPRFNTRDFEMFGIWLAEIRDELTRFSAANPEARIGPLAINLPTRMQPADLAQHLDICHQHGVRLIISAVGNPSELVRRVHDYGMIIYHDVTMFRYAEKAIEAGVDGLTCVGAGGGGHSGTIGHLALIPRIRRIFDGTLLMAGSISTGAGIRAAEILGADLAYMGTRFIATKEAAVDPDYARMLVECRSEDLLFTPDIAGVAANWLVPSIERVGLDPANLPQRSAKGMGHGHLPEQVKPWKNLWSAGQGIDLIDDLPSVADLVARLRREYIAACEMPSFASVACLVDRALDAPPD